MFTMGQTVAGILTSAAIIAALFVLARAAGRVIEVFRKFARFVDDLTGEPPRPGFSEGRPGLLDRLERIEHTQAEAGERLARVEAQLVPNGGMPSLGEQQTVTTLRDAVDRTVAAVTHENHDT